MKEAEIWKVWKNAFPNLDSYTQAKLVAHSMRDPNWMPVALEGLSDPRMGSVLRASRTLVSALDVAPFLSERDEWIEGLLQLAGVSGWAARLIPAYPLWIRDILNEYARPINAESERAQKAYIEALNGFRRVQVPPVRGYRSLLAESCPHGICTAELEVELRRFRARETLRIGLRELRDADVRSTAQELSELADACVQLALEHHREQLRSEYGVVQPLCRVLVLALGKLGGQELNFSSDIDVLYVYEHDDGMAGAYTSHEYHVKLFERLTATLARVTEDGRVFRVDTDLRPEGRTGALCNSLAGLERYYETWGRTWERAVWLKARPIAGDIDLYHDLMKFIRPFIFRTSRDLSAIKEVLDLKRQIDIHSSKRRIKRFSFDVKLGKGGIREIELIVQSLQLLHAGRDKRVRQRNTLDALNALEVAGWMSSKDRTLLSDAYVFLRRLEHRIQFQEDRQTHILPPEPELGVIASSLNYGTSDDLKIELSRHCEIVHQRFSEVLGGEDLSPVLRPEVTELMEASSSATEQLEVRLGILGSKDPLSVAASLATLMRIPGSPFHPTASAELRDLGYHLVNECLASPDLDRAFRHLPDLLRFWVNHQAYLQQLKRPELRRGVARVLGASDLLARILIRNPDLLPAVLYKGSFVNIDELRVYADSGDSELPLEETLIELRLLKQREVMRIAIAELAGNLTHEKSQSRKTKLAELIVQAVTNIATKEVEKQFGKPVDVEAGMVVWAGGALGAKELGHRSDLDLSVLYSGCGDTSGGARGRIPVSEFYTRIVQKMLMFLSLRLPQGNLYAVDMRLRPSGSQGTLVTTVDRFRAYHQQGAQLWERQALVRSRVLSGPEHIRAQVKIALKEAAYGNLHPPIRSADIVAMRNRLEEAADPRGVSLDSPYFHVKHGHGGLVEIEFLVQYLLLSLGPDSWKVASPNTKEALFRLGEYGALPVPVAQRLSVAHTRLRQLLSWARLIQDEAFDILDYSSLSLRVAASALGYEGRDAHSSLVKTIDWDRKYVRQIYLEKMVD